MSMELWQFLVIFTVGVVAGVINTLAGGGSLITLPVLIFLGLPATVANGTNRLAITVQSVLAVAGFKRKGVSDFKLSLFRSLPALIGAIIGAQLAVDVSDILFKRILAVVMILVLGLILWNPIRRGRGNSQYAYFLLYWSLWRIYSGGHWLLNYCSFNHNEWVKFCGDE